MMFRDNFWGTGGFDDLRRVIKQGNEFCKDVSCIVTERADAENSYAKTLSKLSTRLNKVANSCVGTLAEAWSLAAVEIESQAELHRDYSQALVDDVSKPMKSLAEQQYKTRKPIEARVEKSQKSLADKRSDEHKFKKLAFTNMWEREKLYDQINIGKTSGNKSKPLTDKDIAKLKKQVSKLDETIRKTDREYQEHSLKAEGCRQDWETMVYRAGTELQKLEEERISQMQDFLNKYNSHLSVIGPKLIRSCDKLGEGVISVDTQSDIRKLVDVKGTGPNQPEQILPDFYAEDLQNFMDKERRRQALQNYIIYLQQYIEREQRSKEGVEKLVDVYHNRPNFADADTQEDAKQKLHNVGMMLNFVEASHFKVSCAQAELDGRPRPQSRFAQHIERTKDKQGHTLSTLRMPQTMVRDSYGGSSASSVNRGPADGGQVEAPFAVESFSSAMKRQLSQSSAAVAAASKRPAPTAPAAAPPVNNNPYYSDDDEFDEDHAAPLGQCRAIYQYVAQLEDELNISPGDVITIYDKQVDGWWQGELSGKVGIFPATYVEDITNGASAY